MSNHELLEELGRRIQSADLALPVRRPWVPAERDDILAAARACLGIREAWIPRIETEVEPLPPQGGVVVSKLRGLSWERCYCPAHLYEPQRPAPGLLPLVVLCCGHGRGGKQAMGYRRMAWRLACSGCAVLVPDNLGQGERVAMGHKSVVAPFRCGLSVQGLIIMETIAWLRWARSCGRFDTQRMAAIGNSGGGTLTLFLGALCRNELAALSSSGYPSDFAFIAAKEKKHCHCNILPGIVGALQMWQLYGCFAPKPLFLFQGKSDPLFPEDLFDRLARRTAHAYAMAGAPHALRSAVFPGGHPWDEDRRETLAEFLGQNLGLDRDAAVAPFPEAEPGDCYDAWPDDALTTDALAAQVSGRPAVADDALWRVYFPDVERRPDTAFRRVGFRQLAGQMQAFLDPGQRV